MSSYKRKRYSREATALAVMRPYKTPYKKRTFTKRAFVPGRDRTSGFYGRYSTREGELKFHDVEIDDALIAVGGTIQAGGSVINIAQGVTESQRIGRKCTIRSIHWRYLISMTEIDAAATPANGDTVRVILYLDKQCNGTTAVTTSILETNTFHSFRNLANSGRYQILLDQTNRLSYQTLASDGAGVVSSANYAREFQFNKKCNIPIEYDSTTGALTEIRSNNIGVLLMGANNTAAFTSSMRLRFSDGGA